MEGWVPRDGVGEADGRRRGHDVAELGAERGRSHFAGESERWGSYLARWRRIGWNGVVVCGACGRGRMTLVPVRYRLRLVSGPSDGGVRARPDSYMDVGLSR